MPAAEQHHGTDPDTFHKMSKKIAQLTKVIFHLNTKNDEADLHLRSVSTCYEQEIEQIVRHCNAKIQEAWVAFEKVKQDVAEREKSQGLRQKEELEFKKALEDLKQKQQAKEQESYAHWTERVTNLTEELDELRVRCAEQKDAFDRSLERERTLHKNVLEDVKASLAGDFGAKADKWEQEKKSMEQKVQGLQAAHLESSAELQARLEGESARARELQQSLDDSTSTVASLRDEQARVQADLVETETRRKETGDDRDRVVADLERLRDGASASEARLEAEREGLAKMKLELEKQVAKLENQLQDGELRLAEKDREFARYKSESSMTSREAQDTVDRLRDSFAIEKKRWEDKEIKWDERRAELEKSLEEVEERKGKLETRVERLEVESASAVSALDAEREAAGRLREDCAALQKRLEETSSGASVEVETLRQQQAEEVKELQEEFASRAAALQTQLDAAKAQALEDVSALRGTLQAAHDEQLGQREKEFLEEKDGLMKAQSERIEELQRTFIRDRDRERGEMEEAREKEKAEGQNRLATLQLRLEEEESKRRNLEDLGGDTAKQLHAVRENLQAKEAEATDLAAQLEMSRQRVQSLEAKMVSVEERSSSSVARLRDDLQREQSECRASKEQTTNLERDLTLLRTEKAELERAVQQKAAEVATLEGQLQDKERGLGEISVESKQKLETMSAQMTKQLNDAKDDAVKMVQELTQQHQQKISDIYEKHTAEIDRIKQRQAVELAEKIRALESQHATAEQQLRGKHDAELAQLDGSLRLEMEKLREYQAAELQQARERYDEAVSEREAAVARCGALEKDVREGHARIDMLSNDVQHLRADVAAGEKRLQEAREQADESMRCLKADVDKREAQMHAAFESEKQSLQMRHQDELARLEQLRREVEAECEHLRQQIGELQRMYDERPPRPEDVEQIRLLERECRDRETAFNQLRDEMQFYKLELVNREQNYNKVFGVSGPNVGVLNPVQQS
eukprot:CAMPEP_0178988350 /NCGR_PEP_ID=MMETSP0795-20121207/3764_1 /TAXON_ID=88552 /ORGANISM="Amoebophrya sp., Strain Ameob2" /LENGTH=981 /DNA_ID=CAMNT_0020679619 /DNA_START=662 /DNA_END=3604 /DNA_ORIENTATION=-